MSIELRTTLDKLGITVITKLVPSIPAREAPFQPWRVTLIRKIGRGKTAQEIRLTSTILSTAEPMVDEVVTCLIDDSKAGELKLWDFAQAYTVDGATDEKTKARHQTCKKLGKRVQRFFGEIWPDILRANQGLPPIPKPPKGSKRPPN
jgi:hypothetical protein